MDGRNTMSTFNEDSRIKIPALLHLSRLGYRYLSHKQAHQFTAHCDSLSPSNVLVNVDEESIKVRLPSCTLMAVARVATPSASR